jgi:hypothetical protein
VSNQPTSRRRPAAGPSILTTVSVALAAFLVLLIVLATQLRNDRTAADLAAQKPRIVIVRRIYETIVHERIIGATGKGGATTVSSSSAVSASPLPAAPVATRTS